MSIKYLKAPPGYTLARPPTTWTHLRRIISAVFLTLGIAAFTSVAYPLLNYQLSYASRFQRRPSPPLQNNLKELAEPVKPAVASEPTFLPEMINTTLDYTDSQTWFPQAQTASTEPHPDDVYTLTIDKLGIKSAIVKYGHHDLKESLIQYPETAMPGDLGNTVIFGHSVLPQFFSPTNYISIFSILHTLSPGDTLEINYDNVTYTYEIYDMYEVAPEELSPLAQTYEARRLTLITCTPPGTYLRRLIIRANLVDL